MFRSIQWRISLAFALLVLVLMTALGAYLTTHVRNTQMENLRTRLEVEARVTAETCLLFLSDPAETENLKSFTEELGGWADFRITVIDTTGTVLADSDENAAMMENHLARPEFTEALSSGYGEITRYSTTLGFRMMYIAVPIIEENEPIGAVRISLPLTEVENLVGSVRNIIILSIVLTVILISLASWLLARRFTRSVREVTEATGRIASGELAQKIEARTNDETAELARAFNRMSAKLSEKVESISEDRARLETILDNIADGVIMTDTYGKTILANRATGDIFRVKPDHLVGKQFIEMLRDHEINELFQSCLATGEGQVLQFESELFHKFLRAMAVPITGRKLHGVLFLVQDLTEVRNLQTMRRDLIGNLSHDFKTPLSGIKAMVETLRDGALDDRDATEDFLFRIDSEVDRLVQMVEELTELSRIETGKTELEKTVLDINDLVTETLNRILPQAERREITLREELSGQVPKVSADRERIRQVLVNLVHNAIKFTEPGGTITVTSRSNGNSVIVDVADTGMGINKNDLPHIFERFYKADRSRTGAGTGLGLAIARHIIDAHGGTIRASSIEGEGSTFTFTLPVDV